MRLAALLAALMLAGAAHAGGATDTLLRSGDGGAGAGWPAGGGFATANPAYTGAGAVQQLIAYGGNNGSNTTGTFAGRPATGDTLIAVCVQNLTNAVTYPADAAGWSDLPLAVQVATGNAGGGYSLWEVYHTVTALDTAAFTPCTATGGTQMSGGVIVDISGLTHTAPPNVINVVWGWATFANISTFTDSRGAANPTQGIVLAVGAACTASTTTIIVPTLTGVTGALASVSGQASGGGSCGVIGAYGYGGVNSAFGAVAGVSVGSGSSPANMAVMILLGQ